MLLTTLALAAALPDGPPPPRNEPPADRPHSHSSAAGEIDEEQGPLLLQFTYTNDVIGNAAGGARRGVRYLDNADLVFEADLGRLAGWRGARLHLYGLHNNGIAISALAGDAQALSNIETDVRATRLFEAWIDQRLGERVSLRAGLYNLNSEFDSLDAAGLFIGSAHGIGTDVAQSGRNGPSIFPHTALAARLQVTPAPGWAIRAAILDGVPGDPDRPVRTVIRLNGRDGALFVGEVQAPLGGTGRGGKLLLGHWRYTAGFDPVGGGAPQHRNAGSYIRAERPLASHVDGFVRLGTASGRFNMFDRFASAGLRLAGLIPRRPADQFGIAVAAAFSAAPYRAATGAAPAEIAIEASYRTKLAPWLAVQPNLHYIRRPSADPAIADALVVGIRSQLSFDLLNR